MMDFSRRFGGIERLYGASKFAALANLHVVVVGVGGVGSWAAEALARSAVGRITLIDMDHLAESNINRQLPALSSTLGQSKIFAMQQRILEINPNCRVSCIDDFITPENVSDLIPSGAIVLDMIDQVRAKAALINHCVRQKQLMVTCGAGGGRVDPSRIKLGDLAQTKGDPLAAKVRANLRRDYGFSRDPKRKFKVMCVYSDEPIARPQVEDSCTLDAPQGLNCAGYGSCTMITSSMAMFAVAYLLNQI